MELRIRSNVCKSRVTATLARVLLLNRGDGQLGGPLETAHSSGR